MLTSQLPDSLPNKPSSLIFLAVDCLREIQKSVNYKLNQSVEHTFSSVDNTTYVSVAGAVMAKTFNIDPEENAVPNHFRPEIEKKLKALNYFSTGNIQTGLTVLGIQEDYKGEACYPKPFSWSNIRDLTCDLIILGNYLKVVHNL